MTHVQSFSTVGNLKKHIDEVHNAQKDHKCESCGKLFSQAGTLKMHINSVHNGQKDHKYDLSKVIFWCRKLDETHKFNS